MKNYQHHALCFIAVCIITACSNNSAPVSSGLKTIKVNPGKMDKVSFYDLFSRMEIIPLETNNNNLIQSLRHVHYSDSKYFIQNSNTGLFVFDKTGRFLFRINDVGSGPEEYHHFSDFLINEETNRIELLAPMNSGIFQYDINGSFMEKIPLPSKAQTAYKSMRYVDNDIIALLAYDPASQLKFYSRSQRKIIDEALPGNPGEFNQPHFINPGLIGFSLIDTVYRFSQAGIYPEWVWDFSPLSNKGKIINSPSSPEEFFKFVEQIKNSEIVDYTYGPTICNDTYFITCLFRKNKAFKIVHHKITGQTLVVDTFEEGFTFIPFYMDNHIMIGSHHNEEIISEFINESLLSEEDRQKLRNRKEDDNPLLIIYHFK